MEQVYFILNEDCHAVKIGYTDDLPIRLSGLQVASPNQLQCILLIEGGRSLEQKFHEKFAHLHIRGEWFHFNKQIKEFVSKKRKLTAIDKEIINDLNVAPEIIEAYKLTDISMPLLEFIIHYNKKPIDCDCSETYQRHMCGKQ